MEYTSQTITLWKFIEAEMQDCTIVVDYRFFLYNCQSNYIYTLVDK